MTIMRVIPTAIVLGQRCQNVLHFSNPDGALSEAAIATEIQNNWLPPLRNLQNNGCAYASLSVQRVDAPGHAAMVFSLLGTSGALSGAIAPSFVAGLFSIRTSSTGRHGHGRFYMFGVHGDSVLNGVVQSGALAAYQGAANALVARYKSGGTGPITLIVTDRATVTEFHPVTSIIARPVFGVQRRRNIGVGG